MKKLILTFIILISLYTLIRSNVVRFPDGIMWVTNINLFWCLFLPLLMLTSAIISILSNNQAYFYLTVGTMVIDAIYRLSVGVNHLFVYLRYGPPPPTISRGTTIVKINLWPSHIMLFVELILIVLVYFWFEKHQNKS